MGYVIKNHRKLRTGITTGAAATAAAKAAVSLLLLGKYDRVMSIKTNAGATIDVTIESVTQHAGEVVCSVIKDAGDDPDVTDGMVIVVTVSKNAKRGVVIEGGTGVGRVTKPGLKIPVGEAAINPVPRQMIEREVSGVCQQACYDGGMRVVVSVPGGKEIAKKTMNERLGIIGGLSILGTTGIVEPMSEKAIIDTIKTEIDMHVANGQCRLLLTPGNYGREFAKNVLGFNDNIIKCSNHVGEVLDYATFVGVQQVTLIGHAGKLIKLAGGIMNTHSKVADCRLELIATHCAMCGATPDVVCEIMKCVTVEAAIDVVSQHAFQHDVWESIGNKIEFYLTSRVQGKMIVEFVVFTHEHGVLIDSKNLKKIS